ncbi:hypothetical protein MSG28_006644 [Choristoneura fumiferana]|uniref:Uncharacterized protein n=1 Tax=Choristoneura fumiferana TaxID=7141 RepID=A0ACC0JKU9_CHOFU|nr:hypothetical protein MSG28_006644 [Choristoneura fumiferana]
MGTEVGISFSALRTQLENEKSSLYKIDENIKKIVQTTGRFSDRFNNSSGDYIKGGPRLGGRNSFPDTRQNDDSFGKRKQETKTVFSRLSARTADSDGEDEGGSGSGNGKRLRVESAVSRSLPTRAAVLRAQGGDAQARTRNRRIFGSLLGTLHKFKQEEIVLQTKEDKKAQVERKIEEQARLLKEKEQKERKTLFAEREHKKATIKALEAKMGRVQEFERWEASQKHLANFILTKARPHVYWLPKKMTDKATEKLTSSRKFHEMHDQKTRRAPRRIAADRAALPAPARPAGPPRPAGPAPPPPRPAAPAPRDQEPRKRDKFANDADDKEKDESDGDEHHETADVPPQEEPVTDASKMDTSVEQNTTMEVETDANETREDSQVAMDVAEVSQPEEAPEAPEVPEAPEAPEAPELPEDPAPMTTEHS